MKKFFGLAVALLTAAVFAANGNVAYASEQESLVIDVPDAYLQVEVPEEYVYVYDQSQSYRDNLDIDMNEVYASLVDTNMRVYALSVTDDYAVEAFLHYDPELKPEVVKNLNAYSDKELRDMANHAASAVMTDTTEYEQVLASGDGAYHSPNGIAYYGVEGTYFEKTEDGTQARSAYSLYTFVNGEAYTVIVRSLNPDKKPADFKEAAQAFADGITFYNAPSEAELEAEKAEIAAANEAAEQEATVDGKTAPQPEEVTDIDEAQEEQDMDDMIANMYELAGRLTMFVVIIVIVVVLIVSKSNKKKRMQQQMQMQQMQRNQQ